MMKRGQESIQLAFVGKALDDGTMDVRDLAPALLHLGQLLERANVLLNGDHAEISVHIRADFQKGSFEVNIELFQQIIKALFGNDIVSPKSILDLIGITGALCIEDVKSVGSTVSNVIELLKKLKNKKVGKVTTLEDNSVHIHIEGDNNGVIDINDQRVYEMAKDSKMREYLAKSFSPVEKQGIDAVETRKHGETQQRIEKSDLPALAAKSSNLQDIEVHEFEREQWCEVIKLPFREGYVWRLQSGEETFSATMADDDFVERVKKSEEAFVASDQLLVQMKTTQTISSDTSKVETKNVITKVLDHRKAMRQMKLGKKD